MLQLHEPRDDGHARWFPPSAPSLTPSPSLEASGAFDYEERAFPEPPPAPRDFQQYPGVFYGAALPRAPPPAFVARPVRGRPSVFRSVSVTAGSSSYSFGWAFSAMARFTLLLIFNAANGALAVAGAVVMWVGAVLSIATLPLCGFGIVLFHSLMSVACYFCQADVVLHNVVADQDHKITFSRTVEQYESLLPIRATRPTQYFLEQDGRPSLRFEKTLHEPSPRAVLAIIYLGTAKFVLGILSLASVALLLIDLGFLTGDKRVQVEVKISNDLDAHPLTVYLGALALLLVALVLIHGLTEVSKQVTRFFCCEVDGFEAR